MSKEINNFIWNFIKIGYIVKWSGKFQILGIDVSVTLKTSA